MKKIYSFAALVVIACSIACNNTTTETTTTAKTDTATLAPAPKDNTPAAAPANQPEGAALMAQSDCNTCHNPTAKVVGPSYKDIAAKYTTADVAKLADVVIKGGSGNWGSVPMPPHGISKPDAEKMVTYILSMK